MMMVMIRREREEKRREVLVVMVFEGLRSERDLIFIQKKKGRSERDVMK